MEETAKPIRAVPFGLRAYPADKDFFINLSKHFENQQQTFKALCENYSNKTFTTAVTSEELEKNNDLNKTTIELQNVEIKKFREETERLYAENEALKKQLNNPLLIRLSEANAQNLRRVRSFAIKKQIVTAENYPEQITNLAISYLLINEFEDYIK